MTSINNSVRFVLDGAIIEADAAQPASTTVLDYLREHLQRSGTKEGCAEGDCGACVVLVGELKADGSAIDYAPVNSCLQLLPTLDGKSVKTIESLQRANGQLHPVQEAMAESHGTQCGFCTPGIVMSVTGLLQTVAKPTRDEIKDALSGNLCRCTGYKPIIDAAVKASEAAPEQVKLDDQADLALLRQLRQTGAPGANPQGQPFFAPTTLEALAEYLAQHPQATLLAGSTEIGLQVNKQFARPQQLVYLGNLSALRQVEDQGTHWRIGAQVCLNDVLTLVADDYPDFAEVLRRFGSPPIRSTATLAGNIGSIATGLSYTS